MGVSPLCSAGVSEMIGFRPLGNTGLNVSSLSMGGSTLGGEYGDVDVDDAVSAVRFGIDQGMNLVDTSPFYGGTLSEKRLGEALGDGYRERVILATKAGRYAMDGESVFDFSHDRILKSWEESAERLQTGYVDLFQLHDVEFVSLEEVRAQAWPAMVMLKEEGKVGHIGITGYPTRHLARLARDLEPTPDTILTYCHYDLLNTTIDRWLLPVTEDLGIGVINAAITHMGLLTEREGPDWHPAPQVVREAGRKLVELARAGGADITSIALAFAVAHPRIATTCVGMRSVDEVRRNLEAVGSEADPDLLAAIEEVARPVRDINWVQGLPEYSDPGSVPPRRTS